MLLSNTYGDKDRMLGAVTRFESCIIDPER